MKKLKSFKSTLDEHQSEFLRSLEDDAKEKGVQQRIQPSHFNTGNV